MGTVSELLSGIKRKAFIQAQGTVYSDSDIVSFADNELKFVIVPKILSVRENYFNCFKDYSISAGQNRYRLPPRIAGGRIQRVVITNGSETYELKYSAYELNHTQAYYIDNTEIVLLGDTKAEGTMRVYYPCRPATLDSTSPTTYLVTAVTSTGATSTGTPNGNYEIIRQNSPYTTISPNITVSSNAIADNDMINPVEYLGRFEVGDILIPRNTTTYVALPVELCDWLEQRTIMRIQEYLGHQQELEISAAKLRDMERDMLALISPRVEQSEKILTDKETLGWSTWR